MRIKITKKKIKNIIIKINREGEILVSAPLNVSDSYIRKVIASKEEWIKSKLASVVSKKEQLERVNSGEVFNYLGKSYIVEVKRSELEYCELKDDRFLIYIKENSNQRREFLINRWIVENFYPKVVEMTKDIGKKIGYSANIIKFKDMKTRWGSCNSLTRSITYNHQLYQKSMDIIEYVVLHELSHIPYPHHQKSFWDFVERYMPDWKIRRKLLKE